jgi:outer membrane receptor protein involved in Fe transport
LANGLCPGDNPLAGIKVDGVGNRNGTSYAGPGEGLYAPLAPAPEWRVSMGLRWYRGNHTLQLMGRWHDSVTNLNIAWDEQKLIPGQLSEADALIEEKDRCSKQPANVCKVPSAAYWDVSYSYSMPDFMGMNLDVNVAVRNVFDKMPAPQLMPAGHEGYLDNVMGRIGFARLSLSL